MNTSGISLPQLLFLTLLVLLNVPFRAEAFDQKEREELILKVQQAETRYSEFSAEVSSFQWDNDHALVMSEFRRIVQWQDRLYDCDCRSVPNSNLTPTTFEFTWSDGRVTTTYVPPGKVERHLGSHPPSARFQPYEVVLKMLGFEGRLSQFLERDGRSLDAWRLELGDVSDGYAGPFEALGIRATRRLPGSRYSSVIELRLAEDHGYLPCWGRYFEIDGNDRYAEVEARVTSFQSIPDCGSLMQEVRATTAPGGTESGSTRVVKLSGYRLTERPDESLFQPLDFVGNPKITTFVDGKLDNVRTYRPIPVKKAEPWPPLTRWLVFNDVVLAIVGLIALTRFVIKYASPVRLNESVS